MIRRWRRRCAARRRRSWFVLNCGHHFHGPASLWRTVYCPRCHRWERVTTVGLRLGLH